MTDEVAGKKMVVGFLFHRAKVLLVRKTRPEWQRGLWNGVGGVIEKGETPHQAMTREFFEEVGREFQPTGWQHFCTEIEPFGAYVYFFKKYVSDAPSIPLSNDVGESLSWFHWRDVGVMDVIGNLRWLVPLALDWREHAPIVVDVQSDIREKASW